MVRFLIKAFEGEALTRRGHLLEGNPYFDLIVKWCGAGKADDAQYSYKTPKYAT